MAGIARRSELSYELVLEQQVCFALAVASREVISLYRPVLEPLGLTHAQYLVMVALWQHEPLSGKELSALLKLDPPAVTPLLKRLEAAELIQRQRDSRDERALRVTLTPRGRALQQQALNVPRTIVDRMGMSLEDLQSLHDTLSRVIDACQQANENSGSLQH